MLENNRPVVSQADVVLLAVKPQKMSEVLAEIRDAIRADALVVSIAAGVTLERLAAGLPPRQRIVRVMPNTPCLIGRGRVRYSLGEYARTADGELVAELLSAVGAAFEVPETLLDAVTGLSGSGPAFVYSMIEALADGRRGGRDCRPNWPASWPRARWRARPKWCSQTGETPAVLRDRVTSPGGTTLAGLAVLQERGFGEAVDRGGRSRDAALRRARPIDA